MATITTRAGKGSPLTNDEVDANFTNLNTDKAELSGASFTGNVSFGDNDKAIFGASSDLQIYHTTTGNHSIIAESGSGNLVLAADNVEINNAANNANKIVAATGGAVTLFHNNAAKLATFSGGVSVTGTVASDGLSMGDGDIATFGNSNDLQIYHDGSNSFIADVGTGNLGIRAENLFLQNADGSENYATATLNGAFTLSYDNSQKLATSSTGIDVTGVITTDGMTTSADINFGDSDKAVFGAGSDLQIYHDGNHSYIQENGTGDLLVGATNFQLKSGDYGESMLTATADGAVTLFYNNASKLATTNTGIDVTGQVVADSGDFTGQVQFNGTAGIQLDDGAQVHTWTLDDNITSRFNIGTSSASAAWIFGSNNANYWAVSPSGVVVNQDSGDTDFRVESDANTHALFVDAGNNKVSVGGSTPYGGALNVNGAKNVTAYASDNQIAVTDTTALAAGVGGAINFNGVYTTSGDVTSAAVIEASKINATTAHWGFGLNLRTRTHGANSDSRLYLDQNNTVFNETGANTDFRVESDSNANMLFVDAGTDRVGIGGTPQARVEIVSDGSDSAGAELRLTHANNNTNDVISTLNFANNAGSAARIRASTTGANNTGLIQFFTDSAGTDTQVASFKAEDIVFNETSANMDFRVESDGFSHALFVDAGNNQVIIGSGTAVGSALFVQRFSSENTYTTTNDTRFASGKQAIYNESNTTDTFSGITLLTGSSSGGTVELNAVRTSTALQSDFAIKTRNSDGNSSEKLRVKGHSGFVGIGESQPTATLHVKTSESGASPNGNADDFFVENSGNAGITIGSGSSSAGQIRFADSESSGRGIVYYDQSSDLMALYTAGAERFRITSASAVFNEDSNDQDFRVESNGNSHCLLVDAGTSKIGINQPAPDYQLHVGDGTQGNRVHIQANGGGAVFSGVDSVNNSGSGFRWGHLNGTDRLEGALGTTEIIDWRKTAFYFKPNGTESFAIGTDFVTVNNQSLDLDFRVESDSNSHMLFVDAGNDFVGINKGTPEAVLHVKSASSGTVTTFESSSANNSAGPNIRLWRNSASPADGDALARLIFQGNNDAAERIDFAEIQTEIVDASDGTEDGQFDIQTMVAGVSRTRLRLNGTESIFNDGGRDIDFRVESNGNTHAIFVDASSDRVAILDSSPQSAVDIVTGNGTPGDSGSFLSIKSGTGNLVEKLNLGVNSTSGYAFIAAVRPGISTRELRIQPNGGGTTFNDDGNDQDWRVESNNQTHALFVDGGNDNVLIGNNGQNTAFSEKVNVGLQIGKPGQDDNGGHMFMTQEAAQNTWKTICAAHDNGATGLLFLIHGVRNLDQNRSYGAMVRFAYQDTFNIMSVNSQNATVEYRVSGNNLQYRFTSQGTYIVNLTVMAAG